MRFASAVFLDGTRFKVFIADSQKDVLSRQRVDPGDANPQVKSSTDAVRLPTGAGLLDQLSLSSTHLTPNGDGRNDQLQVRLDLINLLERRSLYLRVFDLSGRQVWTEEEQVVAGRQERVWDGRDSKGRLVAPGVYILEVSIHGDARTERVLRTVGVAY